MIICKKVTSRFLAALNVLLCHCPSAWGGAAVRRFFYGYFFKYSGIKISFGDNIVINGFNRISIGDCCSFMSGSFLYANDGGVLHIGNNCSFNHNVLIGAAFGEILIGNNVLIGPNTVLRAANHIYSDSEQLIRLQGHRSGKIVVCDDAWIASNVVVASGVTIGKGCVVGAGSVVVSDLPAYHMCAGIPARPISKRS